MWREHIGVSIVVQRRDEAGVRPVTRPDPPTDAPDRRVDARPGQRGTPDDHLPVDVYPLKTWRFGYAALAS
ncbi:hypothetical protein J2853_001545 [Streptosporangium lutulentum]|uniref:Uncharacterized protein n=1 Tax=Streptosporangium lutulentum TaxID=1461250 RepID=A0ABT9Q8Q2_9ACTN|nr:hypothetical protein [Streptosporangium lutulentum]